MSASSLAYEGITMLSEKLIEIKSVTVDGEGNSDVIEMTTVGKYGVKNGKVLMLYDDSASLGAQGVKTTLHADSKTVVLKRSGALESRLEIEKGERHQCHYSTVAGDLAIGIFGELLDNRLDSNGGRLTMSYTIDVNSELLTRNNVEITVKEV